MNSCCADYALRRRDAAELSLSAGESVPVTRKETRQKTWSFPVQSAETALIDVHPPTANAAVPNRAPADLPARLTNGRSGDTDAGNSGPEGTAAKGDLSYQTIRLVNRHNRHSLC
jgi:hypothetical protein